MNGCADCASLGSTGGSETLSFVSSGFPRAETNPSKESGIAKGDGWSATKSGNGGRLFGFGRAFRGAVRSGSTVFLKLVKTSDNSRGSLKGRSRL